MVRASLYFGDLVVAHVNFGPEYRVCDSASIRSKLEARPVYILNVAILIFPSFNPNSSWPPSFVATF